jgi:hypothetical protein
MIQRTNAHFRRGSPWHPLFSLGLTKARKALKQFSGKLADLILFEQGQGLLGDMIEEREIAKKRADY